jgi:hypothetical protein
MPAFIFLCDFTTEHECLDRSLFGTNPGETHRDHYSKVKAGDTLFLYNFETGQLRGPFKAVTACLQNIDPKALRKTRRNFPWQVRVDGSGALKKVFSADSFGRIVTLASTKIGLLPQAEIDEA